MQTNCMLYLLVIFMGSALGAPNVILTADKSQSAADSSLAADLANVVPTSADLASSETDAAIKTAEDSLKKVKVSIQDALTAIVGPAAIAPGQIKAADGAASVTLPELTLKPVEVTANKKYAEIIGQFIADIIQIPIVLLHAFGEAIAGLTGSKQPMLVYPATSASATLAVETPKS